MDTIFKLSNVVTNGTSYICEQGCGKPQGFHTVPSLQQRGLLESREKTPSGVRWGGATLCERFSLSAGTLKGKDRTGGNYSTVTLPVHLLERSSSG